MSGVEIFFEATTSLTRRVMRMENAIAKNDIR